MSELQYIESADLVRYNANARGKNVGDCVKRSLSLAFGVSYADIEKELNAKLKEVRRTPSGRYLQDGMWNHSIVYSKVIQDHGGSSLNSVENPIKLGDFIDTVLPEKGAFLVLTGHTATGRSSHIVCVIDRKVYDSWDSRDEYVKGYYTTGKSIQRAAEIDPSELFKDIITKYHVGDRIATKARAMLKKRGYDDADFRIQDTRRNKYKVIVSCVVSFPAFGGSSKERNYGFDVQLVFTPFGTEEEIQKIIDNAVNVRTYDRMYTVFQNEAKYREKIETYDAVASNGGRTGRDRDELWLTPQEKKFYQSLPGWVQALTRYVSVQSPGQYSDSYQLTINPLPDDPYVAPGEIISFEAYDANELRGYLEEYKKNYTWERDW